MRSAEAVPDVEVKGTGNEEGRLETEREGVYGHGMMWENFVEGRCVLYSYTPSSSPMPEKKR